MIYLLCLMLSFSCVERETGGNSIGDGGEPVQIPESLLDAGETPPFVNSGYFESKERSSDVDSSCVGRMLSAFPVNAALLTDGNRQYVGYYDGNHQMIIAQRTLPAGRWKYCRLDEFVDWDPHCYITMVKNRQGCLLVSGNMHMDPIVLFTTDDSGDISTLRRISPVMDASKEVSTTYPKFLFLEDGTLIFHYRDGVSGNGAEIYVRQNSDGSFSPYLDTPLTDGTVGGTSMSAYMTGPLMGPDGRYHLVWVWRDSGEADTCHDLSYAWSRDLKTWYGSDDRQITLPIDYSMKQLIVDPVPTRGGINNSGITLGFDAQGRPLIGYYKFDENGDTNVYLARLEAGGWNISKVSAITGWRWYFSGTGTLIKQFTIGEPVVEDNGDITIWYRRYQEDGSKIDGQECWIDSDTLNAYKWTSERSKTADYPSWWNTIDTEYDGDGILKVNSVEDSGKSSSGARYVLRWESLPNNRDEKPTVKIPQPSELRVVKY